MADDVQKFLEWHNSLSQADKDKFAAEVGVSGGKKKTLPQPVGIRIPEMPLPDDTRQIGGSLVTTSPQGPTQVTKTPEDRAADANRQIAASAAVLREWGLEELIPELDSYIRGGRSWEGFELGFYDKTSTQGKVVDRLYPEWNQRRQAGNPISIGAIVQYRANAKSLMRSAGLPEGFYDGPEDFTRLITNDVSLTELQSRIQDGFVAASTAPAEVRSELARMYGIGDGGLAAYFLDPAKALPALERSLATAKIGGASQRAGFGNLSVQEAERISGLGVDVAQAEEGFGFLAGADEIVNPLLGSNEDAISRDEQFGAVFEGNVNAQRRVQRRQRARGAAFQSGGGFASGEEGFGGIGSAR